MKNKFQLALFPKNAWLHVFVSHTMLAAFAYSSGAGIEIFSFSVLLWSISLGIGTIVAFWLWIWITSKQVEKSGVVPPPFCLMVEEEKND